MSGAGNWRAARHTEGPAKPPDTGRGGGYSGKSGSASEKADPAKRPDTGRSGSASEKAAPGTGRSGGTVPLWMDVLALLAKIGVLTLAFLALTFFVFGLYRNQDGDMFPAVKDGDLVVFYRLDRQYSASDCLVLDYQGRRQVRRVAAVAGDTVDITEEGLLINGVLQYEPDIYERTFRYEEGCSFPVTLQDGEVFVLGDARDNAVDSRVYGPVKVKDTLGKVMMLIRRRGF